MLEIRVPELEYFNEQTSEFCRLPARVLHLEHSLLSISKWESKWHKPYLEPAGPKQDPSKQKTPEEIIDYFRCMSIDKDVNPLIFPLLPPACLIQIREYINDSMTATWFSEKPGQQKASREIITSEIIYYWMVEHGIPFECQKWHLNRLLTLIRVCNLKRQPSKKMSKKELASRNSALNAARKAKARSHG